ncbi:MAG TPA: aminotransferase class IV [Pseudolysinimonas sp.]|nr:aminotransferase class IV [Pseudolysinimonas sp.]
MSTVPGPFLVRLAYADDGSPAGHYPADVAAPQLSVLDLAATRGDGVFETISLGNGHLQALEPHLARFAHSADMLDLPAPDAAHWRAAIVEVAAHLNAAADAPVDEGFVKIVMSRGVEGGSGVLLPGATVPTGWALAAIAPDHTAARRDGIRIVLLDRGYRHDIAQTSPWLLAGAKTLSYAINRGVFREAARRGADDALFVSSDGYLLEAAVSNLVLTRGTTMLTPRTDQGILAGTTQADIFTWASRRGFTTEYALLTPDDLASADAAWLVSSGRHAAPIRAVDGVERPIDAALTAEINAFLHARTEEG